LSHYFFLAGCVARTTIRAWGWAAATGVLWGLSYFFWRGLQATPASA